MELVTLATKRRIAKMDHKLREASGSLIELEDTNPETRKDCKGDQGKGGHDYWGAIYRKNP